MDLSMPVMDGLAATRAILAEFMDARIARKTAPKRHSGDAPRLHSLRITH